MVSWELLRAAIHSRAPLRVSEEVAARAAVAVLLRDGDDGIEILFIRRAEDPRDPWSGQMAFPGGRAEPGDGELVQTAIRETREEIGVDLAHGAELLGALDEVRAMARMRPLSLAITPFVFRLEQEIAPAASPEVCSLHWLRLDDLLGSERQSTYEYLHEGASLRFPCLRVEDVVIWGLTYRMFTGLQERFAAAGAAGEIPVLASDSLSERA